MTTPPKYEDLVLKVAELERRDAALREELNQCGSMAAMIEQKEWAEHAGSGPVSSRVESAFTQLHNEMSDLECWRDLALQFDNHRMKALWHLKTLVSDGAHYDAASAFLTEPPITATELQQRLTVAEQRAAFLERVMRETLNDDDGLFITAEFNTGPTWSALQKHGRNIEAALKPAAEGEGL